MPLINTIGAASARGFGFLGGTLDSRPYWLGQVYGSLEDIGGGVATDASNNVYVCGYTTPSGGNTNMLLVKFDNSGAFQWQRTLSGTGVDIAYAVKTDALGNVYIGGRANISSVDYAEVAKYDASGTLQWQRRVGTGSTNATSTNMALDSSGNVYMAVANGSQSVVTKIDASGSILWQTTLSFGTAYTANAVAVDASGNVAVIGETQNSGVFYVVTALLNSSGVVQWQRSLSNANVFGAGGCAFDSTGNVYITASASNGTVYYGVTAKYNSSGTLQWQRKLGSASNNIHWLAITLDASNDLYAVGYDAYGYPNQKAQIAKYDAYGNLKWQRTISNTTVNTFIGVAAPVGSAVYVNGYSAARGSAGFLFGKLPSNGSATGTYSVGGYSFTYAASTVTDAAGTYTDAAGSLTSGAGSFTLASSTLTSAAGSLSVSTTTI